jgi:hypothetical protein
MLTSFSIVSRSTSFAHGVIKFCRKKIEDLFILRSIAQKGIRNYSLLLESCVIIPSRHCSRQKGACLHAGVAISLYSVPFEIASVLPPPRESPAMT